MSFFDKKKETPDFDHTLIVNEYQYTGTFMEEIMNAWSKKTIRNFLALFIVAVFCAYYVYHQYKEGRPALAMMFGMLGLVCLCTIVLEIAATARRRKDAIRQFYDLWPADGYQSRVVIAGEWLTTFINQKKEKEFRRSDIRGIVESEHFFTLKAKDDTLIPFLRDGFVEGTLEELVRYTPNEDK